MVLRPEGVGNDQRLSARLTMKFKSEHAEGKSVNICIRRVKSTGVCPLSKPIIFSIAVILYIMSHPVNETAIKRVPSPSHSNRLFSYLQ